MIDMQLLLTEGAQHNLLKIYQRIAHIREERGKYSREYLAAIESRHRAVMHMLALGGRVDAEEESPTNEQ